MTPTSVSLKPSFLLAGTEDKSVDRAPGTQPPRASSNSHPEWPLPLPVLACHTPTPSVRPASPCLSPFGLGPINKNSETEASPLPWLRAGRKQLSPFTPDRLLGWFSNEAQLLIPSCKSIFLQRKPAFITPKPMREFFPIPCPPPGSYTWREGPGTPSWFTCVAPDL